MAHPKHAVTALVLAVTGIVYMMASLGHQLNHASIECLDVQPLSKL